jgi:hypothetical protein
VRLQRGYRVLRQMTGEAESPWAGALMRLPSGGTAVAVDADALGDAWHGWSADPAGHVLAPVDILRRPDGHDVLLPVCTERLTDFLDRRGALDLSAGEGVTLAVSLLRGVVELGADAEISGAWWLTDDGRPVFATQTSGAGHREATADLLRRIALDVPPLGHVLTDAADALAEGRRGRVLERAEESLFAVAEPAALAITTFGPRRARTRAVVDIDPVSADDAPGRAPWPFALSRHLDAEWADLISRATTGVWRALRAQRARSGRPWLVAGGLACAILVGGLALPTGPSGIATAEPAPSTSGPPRESASPAPAPTRAPDNAALEGIADEENADIAAETDLAAVTAALLTARIDCSAEHTCLAEVLEDPASEFPPGAADLAPSDRSVTLLDEFGGAAVLRIDPMGVGSSQLVAVVRIEGRWLLRDVYDTAEQ